MRVCRRAWLEMNIEQNILSTTQRDDLKRCPFCGTAAIEQNTARGWRIQCGNPFCDMTCKTHIFFSLSQAEDAWQTREECPVRARGI